MNIKNNNFSSIEQISEQLLSNNKSKKIDVASNTDLSFEDILKAKQDATVDSRLVFSKHANERLASRNIDLTDSQLERLENGAKMAQSKGINESLVMVDDMAFIVNVKNNTVVTAVNDSNEKVFTNIDGAVII